jgi:CO dehydrogenase maturation factor
VKIAVSGKGGVGKTTISANIAKYFTKLGRIVYAVDADPDSSLGLALGIDEQKLGQVKPVIEMKDIIGDKMGDGAMYTINPMVNDIVEKFCIDINGIRFLRMGDVKKGGSECYCRENIFLKALVNSLILDTNDVVIMDMGAGIEHLTRGTSQGVDLMLIVTEPGRSSVQTARIVEGLAKDLKVKDVKFIANKVRNTKEESFIRDNFNDNELIGMVHFDESISEKAMGLKANGGEVDNPELEEVLKKIFI